MADMLYTGAASNIDVAMIEYHERLTNEANRKKQFIKLKQGLEVHVYVWRHLFSLNMSVSLLKRLYQ